MGSMKIDQWKLFNMNDRIKGFLKNEQRFNDIWDKIKSYDFSVTRVPEEEDFCGTEQIFEDILTENFPNLAQDINLHIQKIRGTSNRVNPKKIMLWEIIIKLLKILIGAREKTIHYLERNNHLNHVAFVSHRKSQKPEKTWLSLFHVLEEKNS